jgi:CheY-like chemotaxis protein
MSLLPSRSAPCLMTGRFPTELFRYWNLARGVLATVQSTTGVGSIFAVLVPFLKAPDVVETSATTEQGASHGPLSILVAEDNAINQRIILKLIERLGYSADLARDGTEAVRAALGRPYDVIFMDVQMPRMDGLEAAREIRKQSLAGRQPYIVALTAHATTDDRRTCLEAGMDDYFTKPIDVDALGRTLHRLCGTRA